MKKTLIAFLLTAVGALLVGLMKEQQTYLALTLLSVLIVHLGIIWSRSRAYGKLLEEVFYLVTFGVIGFLTESWGTLHGHWTYHHLPVGQTVPFWVPIAWAIAAVLLGKTEIALKESESKKPIRNRLLFRIGTIYLMGMALPLMGESICIAQGVWEYHWPFKVLGVPVLALMLISYAHLVFSLIRFGGSHLWRER